MPFPQLHGASKNVWGFDPRTLPGCCMWFDAADRNTLLKEDGSPVSNAGDGVYTWLDKSSNANHLKTPLPYQYDAYPPAYQPTAFNGRPAVTTYEVSGSNTYMVSCNYYDNPYGYTDMSRYFSDGKTNTFFQVLDISAGKAGLWTNANPYVEDSDPLLPRAFIGGGLGGPGIYPSLYNGRYYNVMGVSDLGTFALIEVNTPGMFMLQTDVGTTSEANAYNSTGANIFTGNVDIDLCNYLNPTIPSVHHTWDYKNVSGYDTSVGFSLGRVIQGPAQYAGSNGYGNNAEFLMFNRPLTTAQIYQVTGYLARKWGLQSNLTYGFPVSGRLQEYYTPVMNRAFMPVDVQNCVMWFDGMDANTMFSDVSGTTLITAASCNVKCWKDKAGFGTFATNSTGNPWDSSGNGIVFSNGMDISHQWIEPSIPTYGYDIFFVGAVTLDPYGYKNLWVSWDGDIGLFCDSTGRLSNAGYYSPSLYLSDSVQTLVYQKISSNVLSQLSLFGSNLSSNATLISSLLPPGTIGGFTSFVVNAPINEFIVFSSNLRTEDRQRVEGYLAWKWDLHSNLPAAHPYYSIPPNSTIGFTPLDITNCVIWLDAMGDPSSNFTFSSGSNISTWLDKSGQGHTFTGGYNPIFSNSSVVLPYPSQLTYFTNIPYTAQTTFIVYTQTSNIDGFLLYYDESTFLKPYFDGSMNYMTSDTTVGTIASPFPLNTRHLMTLEYYSNATGGLIEIYKNGSKVVTDTQTGVIGWYSTYIGNNIGAIVNEVIFYNKALSLPERQKVEGYLAHKWKI
jgi:hypothetical protein